MGHVDGAGAGCLVGSWVGWLVGLDDVGCEVGALVYPTCVGRDVMGIRLGFAVGVVDGCCVGCLEGIALGIAIG